jgi:hypothetical protein
MRILEAHAHAAHQPSVHAARRSRFSASSIPFDRTHERLQRQPVTCLRAFRARSRCAPWHGQQRCSTFAACRQSAGISASRWRSVSVHAVHRRLALRDRHIEQPGSNGPARSRCFWCEPGGKRGWRRAGWLGMWAWGACVRHDWGFCGRCHVCARRIWLFALVREQSC